MTGPVGQLKRSRSFDIEESASSRQRVQEPVPTVVLSPGELVQQLTGANFQDLDPGADANDRLEHLRQAIDGHDLQFQNLWNLATGEDHAREVYVTFPVVNNPTEDRDYTWLQLQMYRNDPGYHISLWEYAYKPDGEENLCLAKLTCTPEGERLGFQSLENGYELEQKSILALTQTLFPSCDFDVNTLSLNEFLLSLTNEGFQDPGPGVNLNQRMQVLAQAMHGKLRNPSARLARLFELATVVPSPDEPNRNYHQLYLTLPLREDSDLDEDQLWLLLSITDPKDKYWSSLLAPEAISNSESQSYYRLTLEQYAYTDEGERSISLQDLRIDTEGKLTELSMLGSGHQFSGTNVMILYDLFASGSQQILVDMAVKTMEIPALPKGGVAFQKDFRMNRVSAFVKGMSWYASKGFQPIPCAKLLTNDNGHRFTQHPPYLMGAIDHVRTLSLQSFMSDLLHSSEEVTAQREICNRHGINIATASTCDLVASVFAAALKGRAQDLHDFSRVYDQICCHENVSACSIEARIYKMALEAIHAHVVFMKEPSEQILKHEGGKGLPSWDELTMEMRKKNSRIKGWADVIALINKTDLPSTLSVYH